MIHRDSISLPALIAFAVSLVIYLLTMSSSVGWHDSAELALTAALPAANHAPGSPLHSLLGWVFTQFFSEPHVATTLMSVLAGATAAGLLAALVRCLTGNSLIAALAGVFYALSFQVWATSVITELYSLSMALLAAAMLAAWVWQQHQSARAWVLLVIFFGLSVSAYLANILLWPAFALFIWMSAPDRLRRFLIFSFGTAFAVFCIGIANYLLAEHAFPYGAQKPDSLLGMLLYMSGAQHDPLAARLGLGAGLGRFAEHVEIFLRSNAYLPVLLAMPGLIGLYERNRAYAWFTVIIFVVYFGYYTVFGSGDYFLMVSPAYFLLGMWVAVGLTWLQGHFSGSVLASAWPWGFVLSLFVAVQLFIQFDGRRAMARDQSAERFASEAFEFLPPNAVVIAGWRELTTLHYFQRVKGLRTDLQILVPARSPRHYSYGVINDYMDFVAAAGCEVPVYTMKPLPGLQAKFDEVVGPELANWNQVIFSQAHCSEVVR